MMTASLLECFDAPPPPSAEERAYTQGYEAGLEAAARDHAANQSRLSQELVQNIKDIEFKFAEARAEVTRAVAPVFAAVCDRLFPAIVDQIYSFQIAEILRDAVLAQAPAEITLSVHPDQSAVVRAAAQELSLKINVEADTTLEPHAVMVRHGNTRTQYDPDEMISQITAVLETIARPTERKINDG